MRVLHFLDSLNRGGAETLALDVCRNARKHGLDLTMVASGGGALEDDFRMSGVEFIKLDRKFPIDISVAKKLQQIIKERNIDVVQGYQAVEGVHLYLATRGLPDTKKVLGFHGFLPDWKNRTALKFLIPRMDANIVVSEALRKWLAKVDGLKTDDLIILYNGTDAERLTPSGRSIRDELAVPDDSLLIGMIGNFYKDPRKDQLTLVKALPRVFERFPNAYCIFAGRIERGAEAKLEKCKEICEQAGITDRVSFLGPRSDVPDLLGSLDVFVLSSLQEGLPIALIEAMLAKVPSVVSDIEPHLEMTENGRSVKVFKTQDSTDLAGKLDDLLSNSSERKQLAEMAYEHAVANFSIDAHINALKGLYERVLAK